MIAAILNEVGVVVNRIVVEGLGAWPGAVDGENCAIGDLWNGQGFVKVQAEAPVPAELTPAQLRRSLNYFNLRAAVEAGVAAADQDTKDWYEFASKFERNHPAILAMLPAVGISPAQADDVWRYGSTLV